MYTANFSFMKNYKIRSVRGLTLWNGELFSEGLILDNSAWFSARKEEEKEWAEKAFYDYIVAGMKPTVYGIRLSASIPILFYMKGLYKFVQELYRACPLGLDSYSIREMIRQDFIEYSYDLPFNGILVSEGHYLLWNFETYSVSID
ncbi:hypothetical protein [Marinobacter sp. M5B]|uniref:hypothetical protein n=1 Tax=Marinobacter sp. M5B TaxID=3141535 RepID=UPI0036D20BE1